jgi:hypothetical protein
VQDIEATGKKYPPCKNGLPEQGRAVLEQVTDAARCIAVNAMAMYVNPVPEFIRRFIAFCLRADDRYRSTGLAQRLGFLPNSAVERHRQVLDNHEHAQP